MKSLLLSALFSCLTMMLLSQSNSIGMRNEASKRVELADTLVNGLRYPSEALGKRLQGDVVISFVINENGALDSITIVSSPDPLLSTSSIISLDNPGINWLSFKAVDDPKKKYKLVYQYRIYLNTNPPNYSSKAERFIKKGKYNKALKNLDKALKYDSFNYELYGSRAQVKELLGDADGAKSDWLRHDKLREEILTIVKLNAMGVSQAVKVTRQ